MTQAAAALLARRTEPVRLVIFDCDGVLIDSEGIASRVVAERLSSVGWRMTATEAGLRFRGLTLTAMRPMVETRLGRALDQAWWSGCSAAIATAMAAEVCPMAGARAAIDGLTRLGMAWRVASNSGRGELAAKFARVGWTALMAGRVHSADEVIAGGGAGKPSPALFLSAAAALGVAPAACLVIEDSAAGLAAAAAAGMACLAYHAAPPLGAAAPLDDLATLPRLLAAMASPVAA